MKLFNCKKFIRIFLFILSFYPVAGESSVSHSFVFVVHEDQNYQFSDADRDLTQDIDQVNQSIIQFAKKCHDCEVFIFRIKKLRKNFFGKKKFETGLEVYERTLLKHQTKYKRSARLELSLTQESEAYRNLSKAGDQRQSEIRRWFFFYGHQLPETGSRGYSRSFPDADVSLSRFIEGMESFLPESKSSVFDVTVFSTCHGGTPYVASKLSTVSDYLIASSEKLHLSHLLPETLSDLLAQKDQPFSQLLEEFTLNLFDQHKHLNSMVTLSLYPLLDLKESADLIFDSYSQRLNLYQGTGVTPFGYQDCDLSYPELLSELSFVSLVTFYKPPRFGRGSHRTSHSGWTCPRSL